MDTTLNNGDLLAVIATLTSRRESGRLQINVSGSAGAFFFKNGKLVAARMGPFSGFPAVNYAVSLGKATLKFDSSIVPPALPSTDIAINERVLLKERFGIEASDVEVVDEDQTTQIADSKLPISVITRSLVAEAAPTLAAKAPRESTHRRSNQDHIHCSARARESRRRTARSRKAGRKNQEPRVANQLRNQATEPNRKNDEQYESVERESGIAYQQTLGATSISGTPTQSCAIETSENAKPSEITYSASTLELTANQLPSNRQTIGIAGDASFIATAKSEAAARLLSWTLLIIISLVSVVLGFYVSSYFSRPQAGASRAIRAEVKPPNADQDRPIIEGPLQGKEAVLEKPEYPPRARSEGIAGKVTVAILVNQQGRVVLARALNGPAVLKDAAVEAARRSKFSPDNLKRSTSGTITYTFKS
ncbi:MAG: TonB family protein [bacterium]